MTGERKNLTRHDSLGTRSLVILPVGLVKKRDSVQDDDFYSTLIRSWGIHNHQEVKWTYKLNTLFKIFTTKFVEERCQRSDTGEVGVLKWLLWNT